MTRRRATTLPLLLLAGCAASDPPKSAQEPPEPTQPAAASPSVTPSPTHPAPESPSITDFRPSLHGFAFRNGFQGSMLPGSLAGADRMLGLPDRFGLCGGMAAAAADFYFAHRPIPPDTRPPRQDTGLYRFIYARQANSNGLLGSMGMKFVEWMSLDDAEVAQRTCEEFPAIIRGLNRGEAVIIGMVLVRHGEPDARAWENHQVLAYAAEESGGAWDMRVYDPNYPKRDDILIRVALSDQSAECRLIVPGRKDQPIRGLFPMPYQPVEPRIE